MSELSEREVKQLRFIIQQELTCIQQTKDDIERISEALFDEEEGIVSWAKDHISAEKERKEIMREIRKKLAVRGALGAIAILAYVIWLGVKSYFVIGGNK
jgi:hypothetical protein